MTTPKIQTDPDKRCDRRSRLGARCLLTDEHRGQHVYHPGTTFALARQRLGRVLQRVKLK